MSRARELGIRRIAMPTNGNAGAAWATYAARAGMDALIVMPAGAPEITRAECAIAGARLYLVDGLIGDAGALTAGAVATQGYTDVKTIGYITNDWQLSGVWTGNTGTAYTVRDFVEFAFSHVGLDWQQFVRFDERYLRPSEVDALIGDPSKAEKVLGWKPTTYAPQLAQLMVDADVAALAGQKLVRFYG